MAFLILNKHASELFAGVDMDKEAIRFTKAAILSADIYKELIP